MYSMESVKAMLEKEKKLKNEIKTLHKIIDDLKEHIKELRLDNDALYEESQRLRLHMLQFGHRIDRD